MNKKIVIVGAGGHAKVVADVAKLNGYTDIVFLCDDPDVKSFVGYPVVGQSDRFSGYEEWDFIIAIGDFVDRERIYRNFEKNGLKIVTLVHPSAIIAENVKIGKGTVVMAGAIINPGSVIGNGCIINTAATVDHDNIVSDFAHISVGAHLGGTVKVGRCTWVGIGAVVSNNKSICENIIIGAGAVVTKDLCESGTYLGIPARKVDK
ncbi:MAG: acetyltransferase [Clostridia bacterium]|nr:acetyltransferase [Clostridia bacterium]MBP3706029.1 acetyltransferase [Clostridia bacterium]